MKLKPMGLNRSKLFKASKSYQVMLHKGRPTTSMIASQRRLESLKKSLEEKK